MTPDFPPDFECKPWGTYSLQYLLQGYPASLRCNQDNFQRVPLVAGFGNASILKYGMWHLSN